MPHAMQSAAKYEPNNGKTSLWLTCPYKKGNALVQEIGPCCPVSDVDPAPIMGCTISSNPDHVSGPTPSQEERCYLGKL